MKMFRFFEDCECYSFTPPPPDLNATPCGPCPRGWGNDHDRCGEWDSRRQGSGASVTSLTTEDITPHRKPQPCSELKAGTGRRGGAGRRRERRISTYADSQSREREKPEPRPPPVPKPPPPVSRCIRDRPARLRAPARRPPSTGPLTCSPSHSPVGRPTSPPHPGVGGQAPDAGMGTAIPPRLLNS